MSFASLMFLFCFLPVVIIAAFILPGRLRNLFLLFASLLFYGWGEPKRIFVIMAIWLFTYLAGFVLSKVKSKTARRCILAAGVLLEVGVLCVYKYTDLSMPLGLSFIIFSSLSYVFDVYYEKADAANILHAGIFIFLFPKITMGPIVRYSDIQEQLDKPDKRLRFSDMSEGIIRFVIGLSKKLIIANALALVVDMGYGVLNYGELSVLHAWTCAVFYTLQIYYDFSGYSDMAIGLSKMMGFSVRENFNYPYCAESVTDFWRRWHISLSSWFRDYVYIPLGGSRVGRVRLILNLLVVWVLTGIWHGNGWNFIAWGLFYFILLTIEKLSKINVKAAKRKITAILYRIVTLLLVNFGWVFFKSPNLPRSIEYLKSMFGFNHNALYDGRTLFTLKDYSVILVIAVLFSMPVIGMLKQRISNQRIRNCLEILKFPVVIGLFAVCLAYCLTATYNPFIYLNF